MEREVRSADRVEAAPVSHRRARSRGPAAVFALVAIPLAAVYSLTAAWTLPYSTDAMTNAISGWYIGNEGTVTASEHGALATDEHHGELAWFVQSPEGTVGQYPPGAALVASLAYALAPNDDATLVTVRGEGPEAPTATIPLPPVVPATLTAVLTTAAAAGVLAVVFLRLLGDRRTAIAGGLAFGLATGAWSVASSMPWTHGPAMLAIALGLLAAQREHWLASGAAFGFAILTRPHLALIVAAMGLVTAVSRRQWRPLVRLALGSGAGLIALLAFNRAIFHALSVSGGYGDAYGERFAASGFGWFLRNVIGGLVDPSHGLLPWAPFLLVLVPATLLARRHLPDWCVGSALGGALYLLVQFRANRFSGGEGHLGYRYPLECLTAAAPALAIGYYRWIRQRPQAVRLLVVGLAIGVAAQMYASSADPPSAVHLVVDSPGSRVR